MAKKEATPYVSITAKIAAKQVEADALTTRLNDAPEAEKAAIQEELNEVNRKIRWYEGRKGSAKFVAKEAAIAAAPVASEEPSPEVVPENPTVTSVVNEV
jgi:hypothetical protein